MSLQKKNAFLDNLCDRNTEIPGDIKLQTLQKCCKHIPHLSTLTGHPTTRKGESSLKHAEGDDAPHSTPDNDIHGICYH